MRVEQVVLHLRQFGAEVGQPADLAVELVDRAVHRLAAEPARGRRVRHVLRVVARVVVDDVEQHLDAAGVRRVHQLLEFRLRAEARVDGLVVVGPVAVERAVLEPPSRHRDARGRLRRRAEVDLARDRRDPDRRGAQARDLVELRGQPGEIATMETARIVAVDIQVVGAGAIRESIEDDEVEHRIRPVALRHDDDRRTRRLPRSFRAAGRSRTRRRRARQASTTVAKPRPAAASPPSFPGQFLCASPAPTVCSSCVAAERHTCGRFARCNAKNQP